jgi:hypothetical protein
VPAFELDAIGGEHRSGPMHDTNDATQWGAFLGLFETARANRSTAAHVPI